MFDVDLPSGLTCVCVAALARNVPCVPRDVFHRLGQPTVDDATVIARAARLLGLEIKRQKFGSALAARVPLPAVARLAQGNHVLVSKVVGGRVIFVDPAAPSTPRFAELDAFVRDCGGTVTLLRAAGAAGAAERPFNLHWFVSAALKYRRSVADILAANLFKQLLALAIPLSMQLVIDKVLTHRSVSTLDMLGIGLTLAIVFECLMGATEGYAIAHTAARLDAVLGAQVVQRLFRLPLRYFEARRVGDTVARVREVENIRQFITGSTITAMLDAAFVLVFAAALFCVSPTLSWVTLASVPVLSGLTIALRAAMRQHLEERFKRSADSHSFLVEAVSGIHTIKTLAAEPVLQERWSLLLAGYARATFGTSQVASLGNALSQAIERLTLLALLWVGAREVIAGQLTVGQLIAFQMLATRLVHPMRARRRPVAELPDRRRVGATPRRPDERAPGNQRERLGDARRARARSHRRRGRRLSLRTGRPSGAARRELCRAAGQRRRHRGAQRFGQEHAGQAAAGRLCGAGWPHPRRRHRHRALRRRRVAAPDRRRVAGELPLQRNDPRQHRAADAFGSDRSGRPRSDAGWRDGIHRAAAARLRQPDRRARRGPLRGPAAAHCDRPRADDGSGDSDPRRGDEATSALDSESEQTILSNLGEICQGRTVFIVAHRLSTVRHSDHILVLDNGAVLERGTHDELVDAGGMYARLHALQAGPRRHEHAVA